MATHYPQMLQNHLVQNLPAEKEKIGSQNRSPYYTFPKWSHVQMMK
jgi:hypothetical protein